MWSRGRFAHVNSVMAEHGECDFSQELDTEPGRVTWLRDVQLGLRAPLCSSGSLPSGWQIAFVFMEKEGHRDDASKQLQMTMSSKGSSGCHPPTNKKACDFHVEAHCGARLQAVCCACAVGGREGPRASARDTSGE